jgi:hypothetical protein
MAIAVMGGLIVSTVLSLVFVPSFYLVTERVSDFFVWLLGGLVGHRDEPPDHTAPVPHLVHGPHEVARVGWMAPARPVLGVDLPETAQDAAE